jgi:hypothetical protein
VTRFVSLTALLALALAAASPAAAQDAGTAGRVKVVSGQAFIVRQGATLPADVGQVVLEYDVVRTGADGRLGITLQDDTRVSLGPNSEMRVTRFIYNPAESSLSLALQFLRGVAAYVSGRIAKLSPDAVRLETPAAIIGVRGTRIGIFVDTP